jgi:hypothetical protein
VEKKMSASGDGDVLERGRWSSLRGLVFAACVAAMLPLAGCGGGGDSGVTLDIGVLVGGQPVGGGAYSGTQNVALRAGQSIELDANESVVWTLQIGTTSFQGFNTSVYYQGVTITETALSPSRIALDTSASFFLTAPVAITLYAVSTYDSAVVATVNVLITN